MFDLATLDQNEMSNVLANASRKLGNTGPGKLLLYKAAMGDKGWILGQEALCVTGEEVLLLSASFRKGYVAFSPNNKKLGEVSEPVFGNNVAEPDTLASLPDAQVSAQTSVTVYVPTKDTQCEMKGSTAGMEQALDSLLAEIIERLQTGDTTYCNPRVKLGTSSYFHKGGVKPDGTRIPARTIHVPVLTVQAWCDTKGNELRTSLESRI